MQNVGFLMTRLDCLALSVILIGVTTVQSRLKLNHAIMSMQYIHPFAPFLCIKTWGLQGFSEEKYLMWSEWTISKRSELTSGRGPN